MSNIFEGAKFGDKYLSIDGTQNMFCSFTTSGEDELARLYRERWGVVICYLDGTIHSGGYRDCNFNIIGKWQEPINEEDLDRLANEYEQDIKKPTDKLVDLHANNNNLYQIALNEMKELENEDVDFEFSHFKADQIIKNFVKNLGYVELAESFDNVGKWYS